MAQIIDGKAVADALITRVGRDAAMFTALTKVAPTLAVVLLGEDPASAIYVRRKLEACRRAGINSREHRLPAETSLGQLMQLLDRLNADPGVHGILVQLPLPNGMDPTAVLDRIDPAKDVDGFHPVNVGRLSTGTDGLVPCTPLGCMLLLDRVVDQFRGRDCVIIGKSNIVGKPVALLLLERECTVTVTHIHTVNLPKIASKADILVVAAGVPGLVRSDWVKPGAIVIDVGINRLQDKCGRAKIVGDCMTAELGHAAAITPVPGGVGPMTVACLLANTIKAARRQHHVH